MSELPPIKFECPTCSATHERGFIDGVSLFRCLQCGHTGHGFHTDPEIDRAVYEDHVAANAWSRAHGIPETPLGVDPLSHGH